jgi:hypothetical protein
MSSEKAAALKLRPKARLHSFSVAADDPVMMLTAIIPATEKALRKAGLSIQDIDLFEVNEAFASVVLAWLRETGADPAKVNVNGGAIAIGHPLGASGARLSAHRRGGDTADPGRSTTVVRRVGELMWRIAPTWKVDPRMRGPVCHKGVILHVVPA